MNNNLRTDDNTQTHSSFTERAGRTLRALLIPLAAMALALALTPLAGTSPQAQAAEAPVDPTPRLYKMLGYNNRIDTYQDEIRMDFVLRVAHGAVDPTCVAKEGPKRGQSVVKPGEYPAAGNRIATQACGNLGFLYSYYGGHNNTKEWWRVKYVRTMGGAGASDAVTMDGAYRWAHNQDQYYTIHNVLSSGSYDYLTISMETDINYPDTRTAAHDSGLAPVSSDHKGGVRFPQYIYAFVGDNAGYWSWTKNHEAGKVYGDGILSTNDTQQFVSDGLPNIAQEATTDLYTDVVTDTADPSKGNHNGPISLIGWDQTPQLWSGGQANWGLVTDYGLRYHYNYRTGDSTASAPLNTAAEGVAPPRSFFVFWNNPAYGKTYTDSHGASHPYPCSKTTSFYYQWVALKNGSDWVPVSSLTPTAQKVDGQRPYASESPSYTPSNASDPVAYNEAPRPGHSPNTLISPGSAQHPDGSIDFKAAKDQDGLDGYFKLVTWPITSNQDGSLTGCDTGEWKNAANPDAGITSSMPQSQITERISNGWTVDTAFYKYELSNPAPPVITDISPSRTSNAHRYAQTLTPTISGTGVPSSPGNTYRVDLYRENPAHPINDANPNDTGTKGIYVGSVQTDEQGTWSIPDSNIDGGNADGKTQRYHAWIVEETSACGLTSTFSNIESVTLLTETDPAPQVLEVKVPHTVNGSLPSGSSVTVSGRAAPLHANISRLQLYAIALADHSGTPVLLYTSDLLPSVGDQAWSTQLSPSAFAQSATEARYRFQAVLINPVGAQSPKGEMTQNMDMTPPKPSIAHADWRGIDASSLNGFTAGDSSPEQGDMIQVEWPDGSQAAYSPSHLTGADGSWHIDLPSSMQSGTVRIWAKDSAGNESASVEAQLQSIKPVTSLPFTGGPRLPMLLLGLLGGFTLILVGLVTTMRLSS
ncbi:hypothetical protein CRD60_04490 [Bifidobacterium aemilianum]|uniref:Uncharacterized protein n=1 Tax=Bifidobacterium aemilianum TaxID=2493120 RepID=A0A366K852_9BIFI|nr:hypothetical protein [Bifidobacterium aemilianum]RBP97849.1 hypothetical protein CRD60_04490 [Bifidobacterium aemilianum]